MPTGTVTKSTGNWYQVLPDTGGGLVQCRTAGKLRQNDLPLTNPISVGDRVKYSLENDQTDQGNITDIEPRSNYVLRASPRKKHELHMIAANIDQALIVVTVVMPTLKPGFIDRYLLTTETHQIPVVIAFNKADLYDSAAKEVYEAMRAIYEDIGYTVLLTSSQTGQGIEQLKNLLTNKTTLVSGQSGVGKSTLINALQPNVELRTGELSNYSGKGQHTTTFAEMFLLDFGGRLIDTPGIKTLTFNHLEPEHVAHNFREFFALSQHCRFGAKCMHENEPGCAVKAALAAGKVSARRYDSYLNLLDEIRSQNHWERKKGW